MALSALVLGGGSHTTLVILIVLAYNQSVPQSVQLAAAQALAPSVFLLPLAKLRLKLARG